MIKGTTLAHYKSRFARLVCAMRADVSLPWSLDQMAESTAMSRFHFARVFAATTGITPERFLAALRIEHAKSLLTHSSKAVSRVCFECGYSSQGTFTRTFTEFVGISPTRFRQLIDTSSAKTLDTVLAEILLHRPRDNRRISAVGHLTVPFDFNGVCFIGLFDSRIPKRAPLAGTVALTQGRFALYDEYPVAGQYILALGLEPVTILDVLLPAFDRMLVASIAVEHARGAQLHNFSVTLRPATVLDPPLLFAIPGLISNL
jgi:AraC family transcriptional regulator